MRIEKALPGRDSSKSFLAAGDDGKKYLLKSSPFGEAGTLQEEKEIRALRLLKDLPGVEQFVASGVCDGGPEPLASKKVLVFEDIPGIHLLNWVRGHAEGKKKFTGLTNMNDWLAIAWKVAHILASIHKQRIVHGNLNPESIVVRAGKPSARWNGKELAIVDFANCLFWETSASTQSVSAEWNAFLAPERVGTRRLVNNSWFAPTDIYSYGILLHWLLCGDRLPVPFQKGAVKFGTKDCEIAVFGQKYTVTGQELIKPDEDLKLQIEEMLSLGAENHLKAHTWIADLIMQCIRPSPDGRAPTMTCIINLLREYAERDGLMLPRTGGVKGVPARPIGQRKKTNRIETILMGLAERFVDEQRPELNPDLIELSNRELMVRAMESIFHDLKEGDSVLAVTTPTCWRRGNMGPHGRVMTSLKTAVRNGARVVWILAADPNDSSDVANQVVFKWQTHVASQVNNANLVLHVAQMSQEELDARLSVKATGIVIQKRSGPTLIAPDYSHRRGVLTCLRFWLKPEPELTVKAIERWAARLLTPVKAKGAAG